MGSPGKGVGDGRAGRGGREGRMEVRVALRRANSQCKVVKVRGTRTGKQGIESCATLDGPKWTAQSGSFVVRKVWEVRGKILAHRTALNGRPSAVEVVEGWSEREPGGYSRFVAPYPSIVKVSWGFEIIIDGECNWYGYSTQLTLCCS